MADSEPAAFLSYAHVDDEHDRGRITEFRKALEGEIRVQTGRRDVRIFQDRDDIVWGQAWKDRVDSSLDAATFLVPVLTPSYFASGQCRRELQRFLDRERRLGRRDLILPVYWIRATPLEAPARRAQDDLAQELATRQHTDWRELRFQQLTDPPARRALAELAAHLGDALDPASLPDRSAVAIRDHVTRMIHRALHAARTTDPDTVGLVNILVDAVRDCGRFPEPNARTLRWVCQSRLDRPPAALRDSAAEPLGADADVAAAHANAFRRETTAVIGATVEAVVSAGGDASVAAALLGALGEISAHTGPGAADGPESALAELQQAVGARLAALGAEPAERGATRAPIRPAGPASSAQDENAEESTEMKYDIFVSSPMFSLGDESLYQAHRADVMKVMEVLGAECGYECYYAGERRVKFEEFEAGDVALRNDLRALRSSRYYLLLLPETLASSALVEAGAALALGKPSLYFRHRSANLPFALRYAANTGDSSLPRIKVYEYNDIDELLRILQVNRRMLFDS